MVFHSQQAPIPNPYYHHFHGVHPVVNRNQPHHIQQFQCNHANSIVNNNNNNGHDITNYPNHVQIHPYPHHPNQHFSLHYSSATPPLQLHDNHHPSFYFNQGQGMESYPSCPNRLLKRDTQSCDDLCSSADVSNGKLYAAYEFYPI